MKSEIKLKNNFISDYGFNCGYIERRETDLVSLELWKEHGVYHVKHLNFFFNRTEWNKSSHYVWLSFDKLSDAKKAFFNYCDKLNLKKIK